MSANDDAFLHPGAISEPGPSPEIIPRPEFPEVPPLTKAALAAFRRELPDLLKKRRGQFVAYQGEERIGFARDSFDLYDECYRRGLKDGEFIVEQIMPDLPPDVEVELSPEVW